MRLCVLLVLVTGCFSGDDGTDQDSGDDPTEAVEQDVTTTPALTLARTYVTDGNVRAAVTDGSTLYLGGSFHYIGQRSGEMVLVSSSTGTRDTSVPAVGGGSVNAILADGQGGYFFGGDFRKVGSFNTRALAHLTASGTWDTKWVFQIQGNVRALARDASHLYIGGSFGMVNGQTRRNLAVIDLATGALLPPAPQISAPVAALALSGTRLFVGIDGSDGASPGGALMRLDLPALTVSSWNPGAVDGPVMALIAYGSGLYVAGSFTHIGSLARGHVASIDQSTAAVRPYNPNTDAQVLGMQRLGSVLYLVGDFSTVGGQSRPHVAAVDASTGAVLAWRADATAMFRAYSVLATSSAVYVGGQTQDYNNLTYALAFAPSTGARLSWTPRPNGDVLAIAPHPSGILLGGRFTSVNGSQRRNLAAIDLATGTATSWAPVTDTGPGSLVMAMLLRGSTVYVAGTFTSLGGQPRVNLGAVSTSGTVLPFRADADDQVNALAAIGSTLYLGGRFTQAGGSPRNHLAAVDTSTGALRSWSAPFGGEVFALQAVGSTVYAGGFGVRLAAYDATTAAVRPTPAFDGEVDAFAYDGSRVFVAGFYTSIGGVARNSLAAILPNSTTVTSWNPPVPQFRRFATIATTASYVYAEDFGKIYTLSKSSGAVQTFSPRILNGRINGILPLPDRLLLVGGFHDIDNIAQSNVAEYMGTP